MNGPGNHPRNRVCSFDSDVSCWSGFVEWCMSGFVEVKTSELTGAALDWAVGTVEHGKDVYLYLRDPIRMSHKCGLPIPAIDDPDGDPVAIFLEFSTDWAQGGPLIERELIEISPQWHNQHCAVNQYWEERGYKADHGRHWTAYVLGSENVDENHEQEGGTPLVAAMRCIVSSRLGDVVQVPEELVVVK